MRSPATDIPSDGLVLLYDDIEYGQSLGRTAKFPRDSIAFKWMDEIQETTLSCIELERITYRSYQPVAVSSGRAGGNDGQPGQRSQFKYHGGAGAGSGR